MLWLSVETVVPWLPEEGGRRAAGNDLAAALGQVPRALGRGAGGGGLRGLRGLRGLEAPLVPSATGPEDGALATSRQTDRHNAVINVNEGSRLILLRFKWTGNNAHADKACKPRIGCQDPFPTSSSH